MTRKVRFPEPTPENESDVRRIMSTLMKCALGQEQVTQDLAKQLLEPLLNAAERGDVEIGMKPVSYFPYFKPHVDAAAKDVNGSLLACLTLALVLIEHFERHMPGYAKSIRSKQQVSRASAEKHAESSRIRREHKLEQYEASRGSLTPKSVKSVRQVAADALALSPRQLDRILKRRELNRTRR